MPTTDKPVTPAAVSVDTSISLREYIDIRFEAFEKMVNAAMAAAATAVNKAELASDKRFESVNEFRSALNDASRLNMPRTEAEQQFKVLNEKVDANAARISAREERGEGKGQVWALLASVIAVIAALGSIVVVLAKLH